MTPSKQLKLLGISLIVCSTPLFYFYFLDLIPSLFSGPPMVLGEFLSIMYYFFIGSWLFHWPAFALIGVGIFYLRKSKQMIKNKL